MELAVSQTCQTLRRVGKRFVVSKLSQTPSSNRKDNPNEPKKIIKPSTTSMVDTIPKLCFSKENIYQNQFNHRSVMSRCSLLTKSYSVFQNKNPSWYSYKSKKQIHIAAAPPCWITPREIEEVLEANKLPYHKGYTCYSTVCFDCCCEEKVSDNKELKLLINIRTGVILCKQCGKYLHWNDMKKTLNKSNVFQSTLKPIVYQHQENTKPLNHPAWLNSIPLDDSVSDTLEGDYSHISPDVYMQYNIRYIENDQQNYFIFPYYNITQKDIVGFKKSVTYGNDNSLPPEIIKHEKELTLFGWHLINNNHKEIILTCNEFDSLAITETLGIPSLSLPYGVTTFSPELLPYLEQFDHIILWFNNEYRAKQNLHQFASKLSLSRCSAVNSESNDGAFSVLVKNGEETVKQLVQSCKSLSHDHIVTFKELADSVYSELINAKENAGVQFQRFPVLNEYLKGHRRGELTIFTGPTGSGKTTFLSELSLDLCMQGVRTLWGSFEIKNQRLLNILLHQYSGMQLENYMEQFNHWSNSFQSLPFYFMTYYGSQDLQQVLKTIEYAIYIYDIEHIVIDNLQFMTSVNHGEDRFLIMDKAISLFRKCASDYNVHITLVVHPRKENEGSSLQTASIYGSAKASQEADNVLILQTSEKLSMQISKNRYSGSIGSIPLKFNHESLCLSGFYRNPSTDEAVLPVLKPQRPVQNIKVLRKDSR